MTYIQRRAFDDLPPDAIVLTEAEVLERYVKIFDDWKPVKEVWAYKFDPLILGSINFIATFNIAAYYRRRVRLPHSGLISYYLLTAGTCGFFSTILHRLHTQPDILLQKECTYCNFAKGMTLQLSNFAVCGVLSSCFSTAICAHSLNTYTAVAGLQSWADVKETVKVYKKFSQKIAPKLVAFTALIGLSTWALMSVEQSQFNAVHQKLQEKDAELRAVAAEFQASSKEEKKTN